jgi:hypothetical protein
MDHVNPAYTLTRHVLNIYRNVLPCCFFVFLWEVSVCVYPLNNAQLVAGYQTVFFRRLVLIRVILGPSVLQFLPRHAVTIFYMEGQPSFKPFNTWTLFFPSPRFYSLLYLVSFSLSISFPSFHEVLNAPALHVMAFTCAKQVLYAVISSMSV